MAKAERFYGYGRLMEEYPQIIRALVIWLYVMQKDPHHCIHCGARIGR